MSTYICPKCGHEEHIFGQGGVKAEAEKMGVPYLGDIPLSLSVREASDNGMPIVLAEEEGAVTTKIRLISEQISKSL